MIRELTKLNDNPFRKYAEFTEDNIVKGMIEYSIIYDKMELDNIIVKEEYRGNKIGNKLLSYLISEAIRNNVVNITLEVRISNEIARNLYKKFGFREVAIRKFYYGNEDAILMEKQIM